jgi:glycosyltransferase involved in cell wall biosynthesis
MRVAILTNAYPYHPGEQFIEDEIEYWANHAGIDVTLLPANATVTGDCRVVPAGIVVDMTLAVGATAGRLWFMLMALFSGLFRNELRHLRRSKKMGASTVMRGLLHTSKVMQQAQRITQYTVTYGEIDIAYCYWNETLSYAAILAKTRGKVRKVVSRAHGADLYEMRREHEYMPLKRQFIQGYDQIFVLSQEAKAYLQDVYGASPGHVQVSPLGVPLPRSLSPPSPSGYLHIISVSFCVGVKRLDRIIEALDVFATQHREVAISWTHIGAGPLFEQIKALAETRLVGHNNLTFRFAGDLPNKAIKDYYLETPVDVLVNTSESEGMPVSIMEAMSAGVPAIAPDVGGMSSLVSNQCGALLSQRPSAQEIADAIQRVALGKARGALRVNARRVIEQRFNSITNYTKFISDVLAIGRNLP